MTRREPRLIATFALIACAASCAVEPESVTVLRSANQGVGPQLEGTVTLQAPLADVPVYLYDPEDRFIKHQGQVVDTVTNARGAYTIRGGVPKGAPVIVGAVLDGQERLVAFTVPEDGQQQVDLSVATTYVTEFARARARREGRSMASYDRARLAALVKATERAIAAGQLAAPDLAVGRVDAMNQAYAVAVGADEGELGAGWATLLGQRVLAVATVAGSPLQQPRQVVADATGDLYIVDEGLHQVLKRDAASGELEVVAGTVAGFAGDEGPARQARLRSPRSIALAPDGDLYIGDAGNARVRKVDAETGLITTVVGAPEGELGGHGGDGGPASDALIFNPQALLVDPMGNLYIADSQAGSDFHTIRKVDRLTGLISTFAGAVREPGGFVGDGGPARSAKLNAPGQLAFDSQGRMLVADTANHCVRRIDPSNGLITTIAGIGGQEGIDGDGKPAAETRLSAPWGVAAAPDGRIFIAERGPGRIRMIDAEGVISTIAGGGEDPRDGEALLASLDGPHGLWLERDGHLLLAESGSGRVRRLTTRAIAR